MDLVPNDVLAAVLQRLAPRSLAVSRCVCRGWRAIIDARCVLPRDLLPVSLGGMFVSLALEPAPPEFFARPSSMVLAAAARLQDYVDTAEGIPHIINCCNGLLLLDGRIVNPATQHTASDDQAEWPPSPYSMPVYSSRTGTWETRHFVREGAAAGTIADVKSAKEPVYRHAVYWHETLYVHCRSDFIMRITLLPDTNKYQVIKLPAGINASVYDQLYLGKSKKGVHCALVDNDDYRLQVLFLSEFGGNIEWISKYDIDLRALVAHLSRNNCIPGPWTLLQDGNSPGVEVGENPQWDSDNDNVLDIEEEDRGEKCRFFECSISIFGFHPFKEVVFLFLSNERVVACHLKSSKIQDLGQLVVDYRGDVIDTAFVYTPCRMGDLC
ncbi:unnamed protein product [Urochloa decumbens]|uniref:F-box domain-containing protein n=1 Tax=Urochloa decumbens TaxID=240449 RepID=A0ABC8XPC3_9POAL